MKLHSRSEIRRARPLLGTIVDIRCDGTAFDVDAAFQAIAKVHRLMSFFDCASDVSLINREAFRRNVTVDLWTWNVLRAAQRFARDSDGIFDVTAARSDPGSWRDIVLEKECSVRFRRRVLIDLGGIAKGFAVDRAVEMLKHKGVSTGLVNAGGDIRVFGSTAHHVHLRAPFCPVQFSGALRVRDRAVATSATYFARDALIHGQDQRVMTSSISVTVAANECMTADALTKVVFAVRGKAAPLLQRCRAEALIVDRHGLASWVAQNEAT